MTDKNLKMKQSDRDTRFDQTAFPLYPSTQLKLLLVLSPLGTHGGDPEMVLCIPGITSSSLRRQTLGQVAAEVSPSRDSYLGVQNRMCGYDPHTQKIKIKKANAHICMQACPLYKKYIWQAYKHSMLMAKNNVTINTSLGYALQSNTLHKTKINCSIDHTIGLRTGRDEMIDIEADECIALSLIHISEPTRRTPI